MRKNAIQPPRLPRKDAPQTGALRAESAPATIEADAAYAHFIISGHSYAGQRAAHVAFSGCRLQRVDLARMELPDFELSDARLDECDMANAVWHKAILNRVEIIGCRLLGFKANEAHLKNVVVQECNATLAQFRFATFKAVRFENCNLHGADFQEADLRGVIFQNCDLREAQLSFAQLENTDLRGSDIDGLQVNIANLKGAIVEPFQAAYLAGLMGLQIKWTDRES